MQLRWNRLQADGGACRPLSTMNPGPVLQSLSTYTQIASLPTLASCECARGALDTPCAALPLPLSIFARNRAQTARRERSGTREGELATGLRSQQRAARAAAADRNVSTSRCAGSSEGRSMGKALQRMSSVAVGDHRVPGPHRITRAHSGPALEEEGAAVALKSCAGRIGMSMANRTGACC